MWKIIYSTYLHIYIYKYSVIKCIRTMSIVSNWYAISPPTCRYHYVLIICLQIRKQFLFIIFSFNLFYLIQITYTYYYRSYVKLINNLHGLQKIENNSISMKKKSIRIGTLICLREHLSARVKAYKYTETIL